MELCEICSESFHEPVFMNCAKTHKICFSCVCSVPVNIVDGPTYRLSKCPLCQTGNGSCIVMPESRTTKSRIPTKKQERYFLDAFALCYENIKDNCGWGPMLAVIHPDAIDIYSRNAVAFKTIVLCTDEDEKKDLLSMLTVRFPPWFKTKKEKEIVPEQGSLPKCFTNILPEQFTNLQFGGIGLPGMPIAPGSDPSHRFRQIDQSDAYQKMAREFSELSKTYSEEEIDKAISSIDRGAKSALSYEDSFWDPNESTKAQPTTAKFAFVSEKPTSSTSNVLFVP